MSHTEINAKLVEEFGNLERLCSQIYNEKHGVTCYIEEMERTYSGSSRIANWEWDLKQLREIRHKRNNLSHGEVSFTSPWATEEDVDFIVKFRERILNCTDPLALHGSFNRAKQNSKPRSDYNSHTTAHRQPEKTTRQPKKTIRQPMGCGLCIALVGIIAIAVIWISLQL